MKEAQDRIRSSGHLRLLLPLALAVIGMALVTLAVAAEPAWNASGDVSPRGTIPEPGDYTISGVVYHDLDGDGEYDDGVEPGIGGVTVTLQPDGETWVSNETGAPSGPVGGYWFDNIVPGQEYTVTCSPVPGYVSTSPAQVTGVTLTGGGTGPGVGPAIVHFGYAMTATVAVHLDLQGRPARPNSSWSVPVTYTIGGVYTNSVATSDLWGRFHVLNVVEGHRDVAVKNLHTLSTLITDAVIAAPTTVLTVT
ncbi:MAG: SdrD B-like domain-containing protein, partial [Anaerolineae bacterium]